ncbi:conjugal transfer protein TraP, partial [Escherichia coli]|uniref:conjugal transfer protein TraP n=1 Tax=Escherichia coli TaxID=562 RepID=UPI003EE05937
MCGFRCAATDTHFQDITTPGKLLVKEINFVRQTAPAGQFPVSECWFSSSD